MRLSMPSAPNPAGSRNGPGTTASITAEVAASPLLLEAMRCSSTNTRPPSSAVVHCIHGASARHTLRAAWLATSSACAGVMPGPVAPSVTAASGRRNTAGSGHAASPLRTATR